MPHDTTSISNPFVNKARVWHVQAHRSAGRGAGVHHGGAADDADVRAALGVLLGRGHHARRRQALLRPPRRQRRGAAHHRGDGARGEPWPEALGLWHGQLGFLMEAAFSAPYTSRCCPWHHQAAAVRKHSHTSQRHVQYESSCGGSSHVCMCCRDGAEGGCFVDDIRDQLNVKRAPGVGCRGRPRRTEWRAAAQPGGHYCESELLAAGTPLPLLHLPLTYSARCSCINAVDQPLPEVSKTGTCAALAWVCAATNYRLYRNGTSVSCVGVAAA